ncbi:restriction endonuclease subunit S [Metapseudomonas otitidis]|uniref:restriction endonuclease subunit S n=1 Tax=Metapseudomonas otitidis TaxID=319939 RepID=UPI003CEB85E6
MASDWREVSLGELFKVKHGFAFKSKYFTDEPQDTVLVTPGNFAVGGGFQDGKRKYYNGQIPEGYVLRPGQVVVTMTDLSKESDTLGYAASIPDDSTIWLHNQRVGLLEFKSEIATSPRFIEYLLRTHEYRSWIVGSATGTTVKHTAPGRIESFVTRVPPIEEQLSIAHILGTLDDKIELNRKQNETLEAMARALFKAWFVDFEPVRAKQEGRWQRGQSLPGLPAHLYDLFPDKRVESELGEIPEGWRHVPFGSLLESTIGGDWGKDLPEDDHNVVVSIIRGTDFPDVSSGGIGKVPTRYTTAKKLSSRNLQAGDIVLEVSGGSPTQPTGRSIYISKATLDRFSNPVVCASFCRRFHPKSKVLGTLAFMHLQNLYVAGGTWEYQNQSTGIANFQTTRFLESEMILMPSAALLEAFTAQVQPLLAKMAINENLALIKLRDNLLPKLISGELRVPDAERLIGAKQ